MTWQLALEPYACIVSWCEEETDKENTECEFCERDKR
jgi:hypothetical protein